MVLNVVVILFNSKCNYVHFQHDCLKHNQKMYTSLVDTIMLPTTINYIQTNLWKGMCSLLCHVRVNKYNFFGSSTEDVSNDVIVFITMMIALNLKLMTISFTSVQLKLSIELYVYTGYTFRIYFHHCSSFSSLNKIFQMCSMNSALWDCRIGDWNSPLWFCLCMFWFNKMCTTTNRWLIVSN